jgi:hypothetical protein
MPGHDLLLSFFGTLPASGAANYFAVQLLHLDRKLHYRLFVG